MAESKFGSAMEWLNSRVGEVPVTSLGWFRCGVGFYNKQEFNFAIECFQKAIGLDPLNYNAYQIMARACIAVNRRDDAIEALKHSVQLGNPSDWQLLIELTNTSNSAQQQMTEAKAKAQEPAQ